MPYCDTAANPVSGIFLLVTNEQLPKSRRWPFHVAADTRLGGDARLFLRMITIRTKLLAREKSARLPRNIPNDARNKYLRFLAGIFTTVSNRAGER